MVFKKLREIIIALRGYTPVSLKLYPCAGYRPPYKKGHTYLIYEVLKNGKIRKNTGITNFPEFEELPYEILEIKDQDKDQEILCPACRYGKQDCNPEEKLSIEQILEKYYPNFNKRTLALARPLKDQEKV
ncbi:hypothetical protein KY332_04435 [Candidatus Woesearchaeota archaeon]|nr:hypothetical protein [Candidatus Woesearchaeota archaeon]